MTTRQFHVLTIAIWVMTLSIIPVFISAIYLCCFDNNPPVTYKNLPFPTSKNEFRSGETIEFTVEACRDEQMPFTSRAAIVDGYLINYAPIDLPGLQKGCRNAIITDFKVPEFLPPGEYKLQGVNTFKVNFLVDRHVEWETETFHVIE